MKVLVVDDERRARERLTRLLAAMPGVEVMGEASSGAAALDAIGNLQPDAVFLDVQMPELSGFDVLSALPTSRRPMIVFVTAFDRYALQAFDVSAVDYLLKPVTPAAVARALDRLRDRGTQSRLTQLVSRLDRGQPVTRIVGKRNHQFHVLSVESIEAFVSEQDLVCAFTAMERFVVERSLRDLETVLDAKRFTRVHKQAILNLDRLSVVEPVAGGGAVARLASGRTIEVSRRFGPVLRNRLGW
jgi:two-component system LytT family response regulator